MYARSIQPQISRALASRILEALQTIPGSILIPPASVNCHLLKAPVALNLDTPLATLLAAEADYTTYLKQGITWVGSSLDFAPQIMGDVMDSIMFVPTGAVTNPNLIYGYWLDDTVGPALLLAELFANPMAIQTQADFIDLTIAVPLSTLILMP